MNISEPVTAVDLVNLELFDEMDRAELRKYIEFLLWHYRVVDAFWFIYVNERFDRPTARQSRPPRSPRRRPGSR